MEVNETGGDEQVIDQAEVDLIAAALSDSSDGENSETKKEEPEVVKKESEKVETAKESESVKNDEDNPEKENLSNFIEKEESVPIKQKKVISEVVDGKDFEISDDGKVRIYSQHIIDDIDRIMKNIPTYISIYNSKHGKEKAEVIAKSLGFMPDITREAGRVANDTFGAYLDALKSGDTEKVEQIKGEFPEALTTKGLENYSFVGEKAEKDNLDSVEEGNNETTKFSKKEITEAANKYVDSQLYKYVNAESSEDDVTAARENLRTKLMDSVELFKELNKNKFDPETGKRMSTHDSFFLAANKIFKKTELSKLASSEVGGSGKPPTKSNTEEDEVDRFANIFSG